MPTLLEAFSLAVQYHQSGSLREAEQLYRQILAADPSHPDSLHLLGVVCYQTGRHPEADRLIRQALALNQWSGIYYSNLGLVCKALGQMDEALANFQQALRLQPDSAETHNSLGNTLRIIGRFEESAWHCTQALRLRPAYPEAHNNLGNALRLLNRPDQAVAHYNEALRQRPNFAEAHSNLGLVLSENGRPQEAKAHYHEALRINPDYADAHNNLGIALLDEGQLEEAEIESQHAIRLAPDHASAHNNLGCVLSKLGRLDGALASFRHALAIQPDLPPALSNLVSTLNFDPQADPDMVFAEHCRWGRLHRAVSLPPPHDNEPDPARRLRIGYVSPDFRDHALARYFEPVLAHHDPQQVEVFCYAEVSSPDTVTARLQKLAHAWRWTCRLTDDQVAQQIRTDRIDILVDLAGLTANTRLGVFAHRPAPVQATWLGYLNTTGLTTVDYRLTDEILDPPGQPVRDTEELVRMPLGMCCFQPPADAPPVTPLPALHRGHLTFGSLHNLIKVNPTVLDLWSRVLLAVPDSRLLMFHDTLKPAAQKELCQQFAQRGITGERLDLRQGTSARGYLGIYSEIDVGLDTFPCTGGVTTCEALWMGVPILTLCGVRPAGRHSATLLSRVGLCDWAVQKPEEYMPAAVRLANDFDRLAQLREGTRERMAGPLCDGARFTKALEDTYRAMWLRWCAKND